MPSSQTIRRTIHPKVHILDEKEGLVEYVASDETLDRDGEIVSAKGWRFDDFQKNAPFVDSHNYASIEACLGSVQDFRIEGDQLIETVKWAIDVPECRLANLGFKLTSGGYLKAVSVGFIPIQVLTPKSPGWSDALKQFGQTAKSGVQKIFLQQNQTELSACVIGANQNALAKAHGDGLLTDNDLSEFWPEQEKAIRKSARTFSFPNTPETSPKAMSKSAFAERLSTSVSGRNTPAPTTSREEDRILTARKGASESEYLRAVRNYQKAMIAQKGDRARAYIAAITVDDEIRLTLSGATKRLMGIPTVGEESEAIEGINKQYRKAIGEAAHQKAMKVSPRLHTRAGAHIWKLPRNE